MVTNEKSGRFRLVSRYLMTFSVSLFLLNCSEFEKEDSSSKDSSSPEEQSESANGSEEEDNVGESGECKASTTVPIDVGSFTGNRNFKDFLYLEMTGFQRTTVVHGVQPENFDLSASILKKGDAYFVECSSSAGKQASGNIGASIKEENPDTATVSCSEQPIINKGNIRTNKTLEFTASIEDEEVKVETSFKVSYKLFGCENAENDKKPTKHPSCNCAEGQIFGISKDELSRGYQCLESLDEVFSYPTADSLDQTTVCECGYVFPYPLSSLPTVDGIDIAKYGEGKECIPENDLTALLNAPNEATTRD